VAVLAPALAGVWLVVHAVTENSYRATLPAEIVSIQLDESSVFLIPARDGYLLFDTGYPWDYDTFLAAIAEHDISLSSIRYVFVSHAHDDHVGFLGMLAHANPDMKIIVHEKTVPLLATGENNKENGGGLLNRVVYLAFRAKQWLKPHWTLTFPPFSVRETDIVWGGDEAEMPAEVGMSATLLFTPGHTSDSVSLLYNGAYLFCGDLTSTSFNLVGGKQLTVFNEDIDAVYESWSKVLSRDIPVTIPSHGRPFRTEKLKRYIGRLTQDQLVSFF
jgi:glyoxylase-like metal-dependent hydrolase (beta-lactamase superfamily II)